ncbi:MAG: protein translocase subunit SecF [Nanoarchaeota archaeon]|mgnify:CR=1 FL=1
MDLNELYNKHYKKLFIFPIILVIISMAIIGDHYYKTGDFIDKDVSLQGGVTGTIATTETFPSMEEFLKTRFPGSDITVRTLSEFGTEQQIGILVEITKADDKELEAALQEHVGFDLTKDNYSVEIVGSSLGESFYKQMLVAILLSFIFMAIVVLLIFRTIIPSFAVVFAAFCDMIVAVAVIDIVGIKVSTAGIAAMLMLIGYSVDTDILITTKVLKRTHEGSVSQRLVDGMKTGLTMTFAAIVALLAGYMITTSFMLKQMFFIIIVGLLADIISTYGMNAGVLVWYAKRKHKND